MPKPIVDRLHKEIVAIVATPEFKAAMDANGAEPLASKSPDEFREMLRGQVDKYVKITKAIGIKLDCNTTEQTMGKDDLRQAKYVIDIGPRPSLPVAGSDARFPVGRIYCVGRNYAEHAREMGHDPDREPPFFFMKARQLDRAERTRRSTIRSAPRMSTTRSRWWSRSARAARTSRRTRRSTMSGATASGST